MRRRILVFPIIVLMFLAVFLVSCGSDKISDKQSETRDSQVSASPEKFEDSTPHSTAHSQEENQKKFFEMDGDVLQKFNWPEGDEKQEIPINIPQHVRKINKKAFTVKLSEKAHNIFDSDLRYSAVVMNIPRKVKLKPFAFRLMGPAKIGFQKGRRIIEKGSFRECGEHGCEIEITLPKSIKEIKPYGFAQIYSKNLKIILNDGLEIVGEGALGGTSCDLPDSVKKLGKWALNEWHRPSGGYKLPENLVEIEDECIYIPADEEPEKPIKIPSSVKKIGDNIIRYEMLSKKTCGVKVHKDNPYYMSDENGWLYSKDGTVLFHAFCIEEKMIIPKTVKEIRCELQLAAHEENWQTVVFPNKKVENQYKKYKKKFTQ